MEKLKDSEYWDLVAIREQKRPYTDRILREYKNIEHIKILKDWTDNFNNKRILKTDLHEEAVDNPPFLFNLLGGNKNKCVFGIDISFEIVKKAKQQLAKYNMGSSNFIVADVKALPFKNGVFDLIISTSTLDHFPKNDLIKSLIEIKKVLNLFGDFIITLNNKYTLDFIVILFLRVCGLSRFLLPYHVEYYSLKEIEEILQNIGFKVKDKNLIVHTLCSFHVILFFLRKLFGRKDIIDKLVKVSLNILSKRPFRYLIKYFVVAKTEKIL